MVRCWPGADLAVAFVSADWRMSEVQRSRTEGDVWVTTAVNRMLALPAARVRMWRSVARE